MQRIEHSLQQHVGRGYQRVRQMPQTLQEFFHQLLAAVTTEGLGVLDQHFAFEIDEGLSETGGTFLADAQFRAGAEQHSV